MVSLSNEQVAGLPEWLPVRDFEGLYEVNSIEGIVRNARTLKVLKPRLSHDGYPYIGLYKNGKAHTKKVHRLVALTAFARYKIPTDDLCVCHLDEERHDPRIANLALGTNKENGNFPKAKQRKSESQKGPKNHMYGKHLTEEVKRKLSEAFKGDKHPNFGNHVSAEVKKKIADAQSKKAVGAFKDGRLILKFESVREAGRNGFNRGNINACCKCKQKLHRGYEWRYL